jgi:hypothetical protein
MSYARKLDDVAQLLDDLEGLEPPASSGKPLEIPLSSIEEDPDQPRRAFDAKTLESSPPRSGNAAFFNRSASRQPTPTEGAGSSSGRGAFGRLSSQAAPRSRPSFIPKEAAILMIR